MLDCTIPAHVQSETKCTFVIYSAANTLLQKKYPVKNFACALIFSSFLTSTSSFATRPWWKSTSFFSLIATSVIEGTRSLSPDHSHCASSIESSSPPNYSKAELCSTCICATLILPYMENESSRRHKTTFYLQTCENNCTYEKSPLITRTRRTRKKYKYSLFGKPFICIIFIRTLHYSFGRKRTVKI